MSNSGIYQLKINIQTSIPRQESIVLTSDLLEYAPPIGKEKISLEQLPFFSFIHKLPRRKLQLYSYDKIIEFFFNHSEFHRKLFERNVTRKNNQKKGGKKSKMVVKTPEQLLKLRQSNFILMMQLLFPTNFPYVNNIDTSIGIITKNLEIPDETESYNEVEEENPEEANVSQNITNKADFFNFKNIRSFFSLKGTNWFNILPSKLNQRFSYLNLNNKTYTISRTIWINDIMNHPLYRGVIISFHDFDKKQEDRKNNENDKDLLENKKSILEFVFDKIQEYPKLFSNVGDTKIFKPIYIPKQGDNTSYEKKVESEFRLVSKTENLGEVKNKIVELNDALSETNTTVTLAEFKFILPSSINGNDILKKIKNSTKLTDEEDKALIEARKISLSIILNSEDSINDSFEELDRITSIFIFITDNYNSSIPKMDSKYYNFFRDISKRFKLYNSKIVYEKYVNDLDFDYLTNEKKTDIKANIEKKFPEFNNFVSNIQKLSNQEIDNEVWKRVIGDILKGSKNHNFKSKIWEKIDNCYQISEADIVNDSSDEEDDNDEEDEATETNLKDPPKKIGQCNLREKVLYANFDVLKSNKDIKEANSKYRTIELFLQMDVIEGKIDESNAALVKCNYYDFDLGNKWDLLQNNGDNWDVSNELFFYSAKNDLESVSKPQAESNGIEKSSIINDSKEGGRTKHKKRITQKKKRNNNYNKSLN